MARKIDMVFNSEKESPEKCFQLATGLIDETAVLFENEGIVALINAKGKVEFYNTADEFLATGTLPAVEIGRKVYEEVTFKADGDVLILNFPIYEWIDNYPNCDGEYDRWSTKKIGNHTLTYNRLTSSVICSK